MTRFVSSIIMYTDCDSRFLTNLVVVLLLRLNMVVGPNGTGKVRPAMFFFNSCHFRHSLLTRAVPTVSLQFYVLFV